MDNHQIIKMKTHFDGLSHTIPDENVEFWFARELQEPLGYAKWERFNDAIQRAIASCETTGSDPNNHFRGVTKMVKLGSGAERAIEDFMLIRRPIRFYNLDVIISVGYRLYGMKPLPWNMSKPMAGLHVKM